MVQMLSDSVDKMYTKVGPKEGTAQSWILLPDLVWRVNVCLHHILM